MEGRNGNYVEVALSDEGFNLQYDTAVRLGDTKRREATILAIGEPDEWRRAGRMLPSEDGVGFCAFEDVTDDLLQRLNPTVILSPVLARRFDCIDLATRLYQLSYKQKYRAIASNMPNPDIIEREIKSLCPTLDFGVLQSV